MKIARYRNRTEESYGVLKEQTIISLPKMATILQATLPASMEEFVASGQIAEVTVESLLAISRRRNR
jgi:hypothetical protein